MSFIFQRPSKLPEAKRFDVPPDSNVEKSAKKIILLDDLAHGGCARSTSGSRNRAVLPKRHDNGFFLRS